MRDLLWVMVFCKVAKVNFFQQSSCILLFKASFFKQAKSATLGFIHSIKQKKRLFNNPYTMTNTSSLWIITWVCNVRLWFINWVMIKDRTTSCIVGTRTYPTFWPFFVRTYLPTPTYLFSLLNINFIEKLPKIKNL